jgi:hypothetical protein
VLLGNTATFSATVTKTTDTSVDWSVNGRAGGSAATGTITPGGVYTAPADLPSPANVQVYSDEPCGRDEIGYGSGDGHERHFTFNDAQPGKCRARRSSRISGDGGEQRAPGYGCAVERIGGGVRKRLRSRGCERVAVTPQENPSKKAQATIAIQAGVSISVSPSTTTLAANRPPATREFGKSIAILPARAASVSRGKTEFMLTFKGSDQRITNVR